MPIPVHYPHDSKTDFVNPRTSPDLPSQTRTNLPPRPSPRQKHESSFWNRPQIPQPLLNLASNSGYKKFDSPSNSPWRPRSYNPPSFERYHPHLEAGSNALRGIPDKLRNHGVTMLGEFLGTLMFLFFGLTTVQIANSKPDTLAQAGNEAGPSVLQILFIASGFATSLAVNVWLFFRVSGGMFNPAVTLGLCLAGAVPWIKAALLIPVQLIAAILASALVSVMFPGPMNVATGLGSETSLLQGCLIETLLTAELVFTILMLAVEKHRATFVAPLGIGMALFIDHIIGVNFTGASMNPARSFGPAVVLGTFASDHWIYWVGPISGSLLATGAFSLLKCLEYESANAGQDGDGLDLFRVVPRQQTRKRRNSSSSFTSFTPLTSMN